MYKKITGLYNDFRNGRVSRRDFIRKVAVIAGSTAAATAFLPVLEEGELNAAPDYQGDKSIHTEFVKYLAQRHLFTTFPNRLNFHSPVQVYSS